MRISLNNGNSFLTIEQLEQQKEEILLKWDTIINFMNDEIREQVHAELAPCTELEFLKRYLELANEDIIIG